MGRLVCIFLFCSYVDLSIFILVSGVENIEKKSNCGVCVLMYRDYLRVVKGIVA